MKIFSIWLAIILAFAGALHAHNHSDEALNEEKGYREINSHALAELIRSHGHSIEIVDARNVAHDDGKRIPGAKVIPLNATIENITANLPDKNAKIIVYCSNSNCPLSALMANRLFRMGYKNVWKYSGGIEEWEVSGQKIEKGKPAAEAAIETGPKSA